MLAQTQYRLSAADLEIVLAMVRTGTLAAAGERLGVDASTVFRSLQRIERGLGATLFARSRTGYLAGDLAQALAEQAEQVESALEAARSAVHAVPDQVSGTVRITTTDTILVGMVAPALKALQAEHPNLSYDLRVSNELASLTRRDADIAVRATRRPPQHLVGKHIGSIRVGLYAGRTSGITYADVEAGRTPWLAIDDAIPDHPSVSWRKRHFPKVMPTYFVNSLQIAAEMVGMGMGVGILPVVMAQERRDLVTLRDLQDANQSELWLLTHPESRHLRRIAVVYGHLAQTLRLP
ncbi:LysR family transcriptional regulator [Ralstonia mojiangensis]|jgi:DNA-binding transcriptional LysR family regulator|uniref:LysR family transcriptional regulator n=1 Tax=Ralstonia mojiangensis TaxID=2953895 RepID=A0AAE3I076_9RALS|nr:LysR family transcriptional regulator [Ralstonia mojiangensis]MCO5412240.1 LysR family transcriptional regulator [Ralstonia mojiangensis]MCT7296642.1 LysR family transcriptional regulator [Ralstonia mojiangensis]MCT7311056.1 LysR family transcriptional regulator [Ralstonia mojiangensis]MCT7315189.1 LysR family transcriptional regulator [Ralstonia mojiangensis]MCT7325954.1 LysR family transcriptional regulator [Ralstonia mojiangensis]